MSATTGGPGRPTIPAAAVWGVPWRWDEEGNCYRPDLRGDWPFRVELKPGMNGWQAVTEGEEPEGGWYGPDGACCALAGRVKELAASRKPLRRLWAAWCRFWVADAETSARLEQMDQEMRFREGKQP